MLALVLPGAGMRELPTSPQGPPTLVIYLVAATTFAGEAAVIINRLVPGEATLLLVGFLAYAGRPRRVRALRVIPAVVTGDTPGSPPAVDTGPRPGDDRICPPATADRRPGIWSRPPVAERGWRAGTRTWPMIDWLARAGRIGAAERVRRRGAIVTVTAMSALLASSVGETPANSA
ncbi:hypothetical protein [Micromonospora sp. KC606]|uniref:hypothetical protein n=1 Tax=Micromonospora sp. KC606 TaxID=2530379 RepID=UPI001A9EBC9F|nr:hypothetical protein [Micromonospora sp. KC606]